MNGESVPLNTLLRAENDEAAHVQPGRASLAISLEMVAYLALVVLTLAFFLAEIDSTPLSDREAAQALTSWHALHPNAPGDAPASDSPMMFWGQLITFSIMGATEFAARLPGVIGGLLLVLSPLLFRAKAGRAQTFLLSVLLAANPITIIAARTGDAAVWATLFGVLTLYAIGRYYDTRQMRDMLLAGGIGAALLFLTEPGGILLGITLALAGIAALWWSAWSAPQDLALENPGQNALAQAQSFLGGIAWRSLFVIGLVVIVVAATGALFYTNGLTVVGELVGNFGRGFVQPAIPDAPIAFPVLTLILYDPLLLIFAMIAVVMLTQQDRFGLRERFLAAWFLVGGLILIVYRGGTPGMALGLVVPLAGLTAYLVSELFFPRRVLLFFFDELFEDTDDAPEKFAYIKYVFGGVVAFLLVMLTVHAQEMGRGLLGLPPDTVMIGDIISTLLEPTYVTLRYSLLGGLALVVVSILLLIVSFLIAASIWGNANTLQGLGIGGLIFMLVSGVGGGFGAAAARYTEPGEFWQTAAVSKDAYLLRETLYEIARRETRGFPELNITVVVDEKQGISADGLLAWLLRDFKNTRFITSLNDARQDEIVLLPPTELTPDLGGTYVGQNFRLRTRWTLSYLVPGDVPAWFMLRALRPITYPHDTIVLWLRADVYESVQPAQ